MKLKYIMLLLGMSSLSLHAEQTSPIDGVDYVAADSANLSIRNLPMRNLFSDNVT
ncbi:hypothetical protein [Shewanella cyperi]|uniref:hypothetical protein n=1 Tax=Shewanella cyperi TaxID=2814292 RepID=UPI001A94DDFA|nr:hypothetical protein [Shewanella cyperi]QSX41213.1 hypothetical protein JYB84_01920 [Shewanella cyperi]